MTDLILGVFEITIGMSLFIALLLIGLKLFGGKFTAKCRYIIWALVMIRLAIPFSFGLLPTFIEIPIDTVLVQSEDLSSVLSENTDPVTSVQPSDPGNIAVTPTVPSTPVFPNVDPANPDNTPILPGEQAEPVIPSEPIVEIPAEQPISLKQILDITSIVYLTGAAVFLVWSLVSYFIYTRKILRSAKAADERTQKIFSTICKKYGMKKQPTLLVASGIHSPAAFGIFRRKIVLPDIAFSENGLVGTLAHEVTHCKRGDLYMKLVELTACSLNWFNPLVHIAAFKCEMEMELSCDEKVLSGSSEAARAAYADVMLDIIRRCRRNRGALTTHFNPKKSAVTARFKNILYGSGKRRGRILIGVCLVLCVLAGAFVACQTGDDLADEHWYVEGYYLKCDNGSDVIVMDADGANPASPCQMTPADDSVSFEGLTDGDRIKVEISMIMTTYPGQTEVYSIEKLSDGERDDIDSAVLDSLRELGWIGAKVDKTLPDNFAEFYHEAEAVYALFTGYRSDIYTTGTFTENGAPYRRVDINGYTTLAELRSYCELYFSPEFSDELLSRTVSEEHPLYREHKGTLSRFDGYTALFGYDIGQNYSMILERVEHDVYTVRIDAIMLENGREISAVAYCSYTLSEDGEIRFTSFELMAEKLFEALEQIPVEPAPFNPDAYAALIPNSSADRLFWHRIAGTDDYLYFCAIRRINSTMTSYTDDPPKDFAIYHINSSKMDALGYIEAKIPTDIVYDTVCPVVAMTGFGPLSCKFILQMTDGNRVFYVAFDNYDNLQPQYHLTFTYRGILSDEEVNELKEKYPVSFEKASKYYMGVPKEWYCFEYGGVQYDLSKIYSEVNGIGEWGHIGKYVVAQGHINPNDSLYVLINTETQKIENYFVGAVMTCHSEDINTIMYARGGTVASLDGTFLADIVLGPYEYIRKLEYSEDKTQITVTIETEDSSVRTTTFDLTALNEPAKITEYTVDIPLEDERDFITVAGVYGKGVEPSYPDGAVIHAGKDGTLYYVMGVGNEYWSRGNFKALRTYRVTSKSGYLESVEEVETLTKDKVLKNGKPYTGELNGMFTCQAYRFRQGNFNYDFLSHSIYILPDGTIYANSGLVGTGGPVSYEGTYQYNGRTGDFTAKLVGRYANEGNVTVYPEAEVKGKLYEYGGFVHFICESSGIHSLTVTDPLPLTFVPNTDGYATPDTIVLDDVFDGAWEGSYTDGSGEHLYGLSIVTESAQIQFDDGVGGGTEVSHYVGKYTVNPLTMVNTATLRSSSSSGKESEFTIKFTLGYSKGTNGTFLYFDVRACDAPSLQHLVGKTLVFKRTTVLSTAQTTE